MKSIYLKLTGLAGALLMMLTALGLSHEQSPQPPLSSSSAGTSTTHQQLENGTTNTVTSITTTTITTGQPGESAAATSTPSTAISDENSENLQNQGTTSGSTVSTNTQPNKPTGGSASSSTAASNTPTRPSSPVVPAPTPTPTGKIVTGYYAGWASYKGYTPDRVPVQQLTHLNYAFAKINPSANAVALADPANDRKNFAALRKLKQRYGHLKTLISIGGWDYSAYFSDIASTAARRTAFAESCLTFILEHGFDGVDLDWEYPVSGGAAGNTNRPQDKQNFTLLLKEIRRQLDSQSARDGKTYYLTIAGAANTSYLSKIEPQNVSPLVDYIFLMAYDFHGPWDRFADLNAPLYTPQEASPHYKSSVYDGIKAYLNKGVSAQKIVLGMPLYGYVYQGVSKQNNGLYSAFSSAKSLSYNDLRLSYLNNTAYSRHRHEAAKVPYLYGNGTFISYEDSASISAKTALAKSLGLAGVGVWELSQDTSGALLNSAYRTLN